MKNTKWIALLLVCMMLVMTACTSKAPEAPAAAPSTGEAAAPAEAEKVEPIVLKMANTNSTAMWEDEELNLMVAEKYFIEQLPIRTEGRYEVQIFLDGQLASDTKSQIQGLKSGAFDICELGAANLGEFTNAMAEVSVPYMYKNQDVVDIVLNGEVGQRMLKQAANDIGGIEPLFYADNGFRLLTHASKTIKTPADMQGVKIRVQPDEIMIATFEALGCSVVSVPYSELFTALQQKLVDAQENPATNLYNAKLYEVQDTCTLTNHMFTAFVYFIRSEVFNAMSAEDQAAVRQLAAECQALRAEKMKEVTEKYIERLEGEGLEFYAPTTEEAQMFSDAMIDGVWPKCEEIMGAERWSELLDAVKAAEAELGL